MSFFRALGTPSQRMPREETRLLDLAGREVPLTIRAHPRARRLTLRIEPGGRALRLSMPPNARRGDVDDFLVRHQGWASKRLSALPEAPAIAPGSLVPIRGEEHRIVHTGRLRGTTELGQEEGRPVIRLSGPPERAGARVVSFLKGEAKAALEEAVARHAASVGRKPKALRVRDTRSRWGSCTHDGALSFSWRLAMAPAWILDYLAAHECAHLRHMDHSAAFWGLCRELCPRTEEAKAWLREHGSALHAYDFD